jgi:hypothetical protein
MAKRDPGAERYAFGPAVQLAVSGSRRARAHFEAEYGPPVPGPGDTPDVEATVRLWRAPPGGAARGGHKTARWWVDLALPETRPLGVGVTIAGGPPSFALSLVQGYYVEPLVAVALAETGYVALPSAAILSGDGALVVMGHSGSGKSSVSVRALARGMRVLGDDQVVIGADGSCWPYPRRLRLYPDIQETAPEAWRRLDASTRRALRLRCHVRRGTGGFVAPSLPVAVTELATAVPRIRSTACRLVVVVPDPDVSLLTERERDASWATTQAAEVIAAQRSRFAHAAGQSWRRALAASVRRETAVVRAWLESVPVTELRVPRAWSAPTAVRELAERLGVAPPD